VEAAVVSVSSFGLFVWAEVEVAMLLACYYLLPLVVVVVVKWRRDHYFLEAEFPLKIPAGQAAGGVGVDADVVDPG
jgi:hypothetical protein